MPYVNLNGRQVFVPDAGISGEELIDRANPNKRPGRRTTIIKGPNAEPVDPQKRYKPSDLVDKYGKPVKTGDMPDRTKGGWLSTILRALIDNELPQENRQSSYSQTSTTNRTASTQPHTVVSNTLFWGQRTALSKRIIIEQCEDIARNRFKDDVIIDHENAHTFVVKNYLLPSKWHSVPGVVNNRTSLSIVFPTEYPKIAPIGFYLKATISNAPNGHFYAQAYHNADKVMLDHGWKWYCVYVKEGTWQPAIYRRPNDWRRGDNIWTYFDLIKESLTTND
jgi:hypothetical protein